MEHRTFFTISARSAETGTPYDFKGGSGRKLRFYNLVKYFHAAPGIHAQKRTWFQRLLLIILFASAGFVPEYVFSQSFGTAGSFTRIGFSPRGISMGNAMTASVTGQTPGFYNPALSAIKSDYRHADLSTSAMKFDRKLHTASVRFQLPPSAGLSFHLMNAKVDNIDGRNSSGYHTGMLSVNEFMFSGQFGIWFSERFHAGIGISYFLANYHSEIPNATSVGIDLGVLIHLSNSLRIALTAKDLLAAYDFDTSELYGSEARTNSNFQFPDRYIAGISYSPGEDLTINGEFEIRNNSLNIRESETTDPSAPDRLTSHNGISTFFRSGAEYHLHERITLRTGIQANEAGHSISIQPAAGFSLHLPYDKFAPSIDYAFLREPSGLSAMHVFALRFRL